MPNDLIDCPFCKRPDFDLIGLKTHFVLGFCPIYNETKTFDELHPEQFKSKTPGASKTES